MIQSMTGFGKHVIQLPTKKITIEIKSLNSKSLDLNARIPGAYREKELQMRKIIANSLERGKVDFGLYVENTGDETLTQVNAVVVKQYIKQLQNITPGDDIDFLQIALGLPDVLRTEREDIDAEEFNVILDALAVALQNINEFRSEEGKVLENDFKLRIAKISALLQEVIAIDPDRKLAVRERLDKALADLTVQVDENRYEQELIYYLEKYDITEEKVRLANHLSFFTDTVASTDSNGRKLGFLCQEIGREINTIGSKANYAPMQQIVVQMKDELEKIKEQMLNVL